MQQADFGTVAGLFYSASAAYRPREFRSVGSEELEGLEKNNRTPLLGSSPPNQRCTLCLPEVKQVLPSRSEARCTFLPEHSESQLERMLHDDRITNLRSDGAGSLLARAKKRQGETHFDISCAPGYLPSIDYLRHSSGWATA